MGLEAIIILIVVTLTNVIGWIVSNHRNSNKFAREFGSVTNEINTLKETLNNGLCSKVDEIDRKVSRIEGIIEGLHAHI